MYKKAARLLLWKWLCSFFSVFQAEKPYLVRHLLRSERVPFILRTVKTEGEKSMLNIAICDDSREDRKRLRKFLEETGFLVSIQEFESGEALLRLEENFPVIFLDIDMKGISGIETARLLRKKDKKAKIIYVTAYDDFREYAFSVHAFAYFVKPLDGEKIRQILKEAMEYTEEEMDVLLGFETETGFRKIGSRDILYLEYRNRKVRLVTLAGEFWLRESIGAMEKRLAPYGFYMPHKSFVVNFFHVKNLKGYDITMSDGSLVPLSQKKSSVFREELAVWLSEQI